MVSKLIVAVFSCLWIFACHGSDSSFDFELGKGKFLDSVGELQRIVREDGRVPVIMWDEDTNIASAVHAAGIPMLVKNTVVARWPALQKWNPAYIVEKLPELPQVEVSNDRVVMYWHANRAMADPSQRQEVLRHGMSTASFFESMEEGPHKYRYLMSKLENVAVLESDLAPLAPLAPRRKVPVKEKAYLWMGGRGTVAHAHFDSAYNAYVQILGEKTWTLMPPSAAANLSLYPDIHPRCRQTQFSDDEVFSNVERVRALGGVQVTIRPGDVLLLPPHWIHRVQASEELSVSVNVWHEAEDHDRFTRAVNHPVPFDVHWSPYERASALFTFLLNVAEHLGLSGDTYGELARSRFHPLIGRSTLQKQAIDDDWAFCIDEEPPEEFGAEGETLSAGAADIARLLNVTNGAVRQLLLWDYTENLVANTLGAHKVGGFLEACFSQLP